jgi:hypothetical protein
MPSTKLIDALHKVGWDDNVKAFTSNAALVVQFATPALRLAIWAKQFESADSKNPALSFIRGMQASALLIPVLSALSLYPASAAAIRTMLENSLYYTYFRTHPCELATLVRDKKYYVDRAFVVDYHKKHTRDFVALQNACGLIPRLAEIYSELSSVVHGQLPGAWSSLTSIGGVHPILGTANRVALKFGEAEGVIHDLFLCTAGRELWNDFSSAAKGRLLKGLGGDFKTTLALDSA